jgi:predicted DNA-binding protein
VWGFSVFLSHHRIDGHNPGGLRHRAFALTERTHVSKLTGMEVRFKPETQSRLTELASKSGRPTDDLVEDAMAAYLAEVAEVRGMLDSRYDDIKSGQVKPIDGEAFFESLRQREKELPKKHSPK